MKNLILFFLVAITAVSCTHFRNTNFNHQKFTNLKPLESSKEVNTSDISENKKEIPSEFTYENFPADDSTGCDTMWLSNGEVYVCTILEENKESVTFTRCPPDSSEFKMNKLYITTIKHNILTSDSKVTVEINEDDESEDQYTVQQTENLKSSGSAELKRKKKAHNWNILFNVALVIFLAGLLLLSLTLIGFPYAIGLVLLFISWFMSLVLLGTSSKKSKNFDKSAVRGYNAKITLSVLYAIGPMIALAFIIALIILFLF